MTGRRTFRSLSWRPKRSAPATTTARRHRHRRLIKRHRLKVLAHPLGGAAFAFGVFFAAVAAGGFVLEQPAQQAVSGVGHAGVAGISGDERREGIKRSLFGQRQHGLIDEPDRGFTSDGPACVVFEADVEGDGLAWARLGRVLHGDRDEVLSGFDLKRQRRGHRLGAPGGVVALARAQATTAEHDVYGQVGGGLFVERNRQRGRAARDAKGPVHVLRGALDDEQTRRGVEGALDDDVGGLVGCVAGLIGDELKDAGLPFLPAHGLAAADVEVRRQGLHAAQRVFGDELDDVDAGAGAGEGHRQR